MKLKSILLVIFFITSVHLQAQIVAVSEGTSSNFKTLLELPDGSVLAGIDANFYGESYSNFTLLKFDNKGHLDEHFGNQGKFRQKAPSGTEEEKQVMHIEDILLLSDGKILVTGLKEYSEDNVFLLRLLPNGNPDSTFGSNGYTNLPQTYLSKPIIRLIKIDSKNIFASYINESGNIGSFRINENGIPDISYGDNGQFSYYNRQQKAYYANYGNIEKDARNRLYFTTFCQSNEDGHIMQIYRVTEDGKLDKDFADNGVRKLLTDKEYKKYFKAGNTAFLPDNKILVSTKYVVTKDNKATGYHIVFKLNEDGSPDLTFAEKGMATISITPGDDPMSRIANLPDGKIMTWDIADLIAPGNNLKTKVLVGRRLSKNGQVDKTFGKNGVGLNTLLQLSGVIDFKGMDNTEKYYYVFGFSYLKVDDPWLSTVIKLKMLPNNKLEDIIKNDIAFNELNEPGVIGLSITAINTGEINTNSSVAITKGDQGGKQPTQEEKNLMTMIKTLVNEAEKVRAVFTTFDKKQMSGGVVSLDFVTNSALLEKAIKNYISVSNSFANGKYGIRTNGWKNYVPLSLFLKRENELTDEMKNLIDHIDKCLEYIDKFTRDNKRMPAGVGNYMEMADYKFSKRIDEFIKTYKSIILE